MEPLVWIEWHYFPLWNCSCGLENITRAYVVFGASCKLVIFSDLDEFSFLGYIIVRISSWPRASSAHRLFKIMFIELILREIACFELVSLKRRLVQEGACRWSCGRLHPISLYSLLLTPCFEEKKKKNPIIEGGCARLERWAGSTSVWREGGREGMGPIGRVQAAQTGPWVWGRCDTQLNRHRPQCQMTHSDTLCARRASPGEET